MKGTKVLILLVDLFVSLVIVLKILVYSLFMIDFKLVKHECAVNWGKTRSDNFSQFYAGD